MPVIKKRKLILEHDRSFLLPPIARVSVAPLTPTFQLRKLMPQAQALSQSRSTSGLAKTTVSTLGSLLRINSRRPCPPTDPQSPGPPRKENRVSLCFHKFNPRYPDPQFQSASRPHFLSLPLTLTGPPRSTVESSETLQLTMGVPTPCVPRDLWLLRQSDLPSLQGPALCSK